MLRISSPVKTTVAAECIPRGKKNSGEEGERGLAANPRVRSERDGRELSGAPKPTRK